MSKLFASLPLVAALLYAEPADWIVTAKWVVTMDAQRRVIENGAVAINGSTIAAVGPSAEIEKRFTARQRLDRPNAALIPGLVNTHTHAAMTLLRGIADDLTLQDWLEKYIFPAEAKNVDAEFVRWGTRLAALEMLLSGTTTFCDMYYFEDVVAAVAKEAGMRGVLGQTIIGFPAPDAKTPEAALQRTEAFLKQFATDPLVTPAVAPHAIYTNSDATLKAARALATRYKKPLIIHLSETKRENDDSTAKRRMSPTRTLDALGFFNVAPVVAAHGVWFDDADIAVLKNRGVGVAHCPSSNMKLASGDAPIVKLLAAGVPVGLGTDGPAGSNNDLNLMEELDLAGKLAKVTLNDPRALPAQTLLEMATIQGARVLGLDKRIGSLEAGKLADLVQIDLSQPHTVPSYNVYSTLVYAAKGSDVQDVMIHGRLVVRGRSSVTLNRDAILAKAAEYRTRVQASLR
jgi:5-methylthioadenosine/S-adenosylhomocysteine deaminase